ncbi:MAG: acyltransferase [Candidatus Micrarchaeia archaeon]
MAYIEELVILFVLLAVILFWKEKKSESFLSFRMTNEMKGLAILMVFLVHTQYGASLLMKCGGYGVGLFLFLSGYGLYQSNRLELANSANYIKKRLLKLLPSFSIYMAVFTVVWVLFPSVTYPVLGNHMPTSITSFIYDNFAFSPVWFILFILFWYAVYYLAIKSSISKEYKIASLFLAGFLIVGLRPFESGPYWQPILEWFVYPFCFPLGVLISHRKEAVENFLSTKAFIPVINRIALCLAIFLCVYLITDAFSTTIHPTLPSPLTSALFVFGVLFLFYFFLKEHRSRFLSILGDVSYELYFFHLLFLVVFIDFGQKYLWNNYLVSFFMALVVSILASWAVKKTADYLVARMSPIKC